MTSTISTTNGAYTAATGKARELTEKSVETFKQGVEKFTEQANVVAWIPEVDLTESVTRYFEYVQKSVDFNRDLAVRWAEIVTSLYGAAGPEGPGPRHRAGQCGRGRQDGRREAGQGC